jgi:hypothetical protein
MSRSVRKTPIFGNAQGVSEKADKRSWHQRWRARARSLLTGASDLEAYCDPDKRLVSDTRAMAKDGKRYWTPYLYPTSPGLPGYEEREERFSRDLRKK